TRCQRSCGERPRNRFTSSCSRLSTSSMVWTAVDIGGLASRAGAKVTRCDATKVKAAGPGWYPRGSAAKHDRLSKLLLGADQPRLECRTGRALAIRAVLAHGRDHRSADAQCADH